MLNGKFKIENSMSNINNDEKNTDIEYWHYFSRVFKAKVTQPQFHSLIINQPGKKEALRWLYIFLMCTYWVDKINDIWIVSYCWQINKKNHIITETVIHFKHLPGFSFSRVNEHARFTTILVASNRLDGQQFDDKRTPFLSSFCWIFSWNVSMVKNKTSI